MNKNNDNFGYLRVMVGGADNTLPLGGALVYIYSDAEHGRRLIYSLMTNEDGLTDTVALPTPPLSDSFDETQPVKPYTNYLMIVQKNGYIPINERTVPVFPGITSLQKINMIPLPEGGAYER